MKINFVKEYGQVKLKIQNQKKNKKKITKDHIRVILTINELTWSQEVCVSLKFWDFFTVYDIILIIHTIHVLIHIYNLRSSSGESEGRG